MIIVHLHLHLHLPPDGGLEVSIIGHFPWHLEWWCFTPSEAASSFSSFSILTKNTKNKTAKKPLPTHNQQATWLISALKRPTRRSLVNRKGEIHRRFQFLQEEWMCLWGETLIYFF